MIKGTGIDIVELIELEAFIDDQGFLERIFRQTEIKLIPFDAKRQAFIAGRFAAKEATLKAIGVGFGDGIAFTDIEVTRLANEAPRIGLYGEIKQIADSMNIQQLSVSISHSRNLAIASVIAS